MIVTITGTHILSEQHSVPLQAIVNHSDRHPAWGDTRGTLEFQGVDQVSSSGGGLGEKA